MKKIKLLVLAFIILVLNLIWEFSHYGLYNDLTGIPATPHLIMASFSDVAWIFLIFGIISLIFKSLTWFDKQNKLEYVLIIIFGIAMAISIEIINLSLGRWAYKEIMPTIFGVGLSPLLQLAITGILSLWIFRKLVH